MNWQNLEVLVIPNYAANANPSCRFSGPFQAFFDSSLSSKFCDEDLRHPGPVFVRRPREVFQGSAGFGKSNPMVYDVIIVGGGIVGLATAYRLLEARPQLKMLLLEKEAQTRRPPDRQQQRRAPFRPLLQARLGKGPAERRRVATNGRLLPRARHRARTMRQNRRRHRRKTNCRAWKICGSAATPTDCSACEN